MQVETLMDGNGFPVLTPETFNRARAVTGMRVADLVVRAKGAVAGSTMHAFARATKSRLRYLNNREIVTVFKDAGVEFVPAVNRTAPDTARI